MIDTIEFNQSRARKISEYITVFCSEEINPSELPNTLLDDYVQSYDIAMSRLSEVLIPDEDCKVDIYITTCKSDLKALLGDFFVGEIGSRLGFVSSGIYIAYFSEDELQKVKAGKIRNNLNGLCHEFIHILLPSYVMSDNIKVSHYLTSIFKEGISVILSNQIKKHDEINNEVCIRNILNNGINSFSNNIIEENFAYQYVAELVRRTDILLSKNLGNNSTPNLFSLLHFIKDRVNISENNIFNNLRVELGIDVSQVERELRIEWGMSEI